MDIINELKQLLPIVDYQENSKEIILYLENNFDAFEKLFKFVKTYDIPIVIMLDNGKLKLRIKKKNNEKRIVEIKI